MVTVNVEGNVTVENPNEPGRKTILIFKGATINVTNPHLYGNGDYSSVREFKKREIKDTHIFSTSP